MRQGHQYVIAQKFMRHPIKSRTSNWQLGSPSNQEPTGISSPCVRAIHGGSATMGTGAPHARSGSRKANCQFRVVLSCAQLRNWALIRLAPARSAASRTDLKKLAPARLASVNVAPLRIVPRKSALRQSAPARLALARSRPRKLAFARSAGVPECAARHAFQASAPCFSSD